MDELISRQAALVAVKDALIAWSYMPEWRDEKILEAIAELPPAPQLSTNLAEVGTDCISRQAAIEDVKTWEAVDSRERRLKIDVIEWLKEFPSAQPKRGKWILDRSGAYCCSECMEPCAGYVMMKPRDKYCKMCGSRNEVTT